MRHGTLAISLLLTTICHAQPIRLPSNLDEAQRPISVLLNLEPRQDSFEGVREIEPIGFMSDRFIVWSEVVHYNERSEKSSN